MPDEKFLKPGKYMVTATIRQHVVIEQAMPEVDVVDEALNDPGSELIDWEIEGGDESQP